MIAKLDSGFGHRVAMNSKIAGQLGIDISKGVPYRVQTLTGEQIHPILKLETLIIDFPIRYLYPNLENEFQEFSYNATSGPIEIVDTLPDNLILFGDLFLENNGFELVINGLLVYIDPMELDKLIQI